VLCCIPDPHESVGGERTGGLSGSTTVAGRAEFATPLARGVNNKAPNPAGEDLPSPTTSAVCQPAPKSYSRPRRLRVRPVTPRECGGGGAVVGAPLCVSARPGQEERCPYRLRSPRRRQREVRHVRASLQREAPRPDEARPGGGPWPRPVAGDGPIAPAASGEHVPGSAYRPRGGVREGVGAAGAAGQAPGNREKASRASPAPASAQRDAPIANVSGRLRTEV